MNSVMRKMRDTNQILRIKHIVRKIRKVVNSNWIHVMDDDLLRDLISIKTKIAPVVSYDDLIPKSSPF